ncbi:hypothetical protein [Methylobacterium durans]|uniref:Uncharacterized protein n=1 Tax=Methylobacterium durans TaxID=2202825 RepID=A0A2U8WDU4_9HYPH|nr:hypothetical protein [Methylobacterium durans]AWN43486.1 hypothetical protein DK389_26985 [Methylobacterium durans]
MIRRDLSAVIAQILIETNRVPGLGPWAAAAWAMKIWPEASHAEVLRGYYIAVEIFEDDYLFEAA